MTDVPVFTITRLFDTDIETMFDAWADPEMMVQWSGPKGATVSIVSGRVAEGETTFSRSEGEQFPVMYTLATWQVLDRPNHIVWDQSFADAEGNVSTAPFFPHWPRVLRTDVRFETENGGTRVTLDWTPIDTTPEALAEFEKQMSGMTHGWGGSFDKLEEMLRAA